MGSRELLTFGIIFCFAVSGCAVSKPLESKEDMSKPNKELKRGKVTKDELWSEVTKLKQDNDVYQRTIGEKQNEIDQLIRKVADLNKEVETAKMEKQQVKDERQTIARTAVAEGSQDELTRLKQENDAYQRANGEKQNEIDRLNKQIAESNRDLQTAKVESQQAGEAKQTAVAKIAPAEAPPGGQLSTPEEKPAAGSQETTTDLKTLKVKVLSGDGKMSSAKQMVKTLVKLGYRIKFTGMAPRANFAANTIYFAPDYKNEANNMAIQLGGNTISKPLTWPSEFNIIVVAVH